MTKLNKWIKWQKKITDELIDLHASRQIYESYVEIIYHDKSVLNEGLRFHSWVKDNYVVFCSMAVRRQTDNNPYYKDAISLARLVHDITNNPKELRREWFIELWAGAGESVPGIADQEFTRLAGKGAYFDPKIGLKDLERLSEVAKDIKDMVDRVFAHSTNKQHGKVTFDDVNRCIDRFREVLQRYITLLTTHHNNVDPIVPMDWQNAFTKPWVKDHD